MHSELFILFILFDDGIAFHFEEVFHFLAVVSENGNSMPLRHPICKDIFRVAVSVKLASATVFARGVAAGYGGMDGCPAFRIADLNRCKRLSYGEDDLNRSALLIFRMAADIILARSGVVLTVYLTAGYTVRIDNSVARSIYNRVRNITRAVRKIKRYHSGNG